MKSDSERPFNDVERHHVERYRRAAHAMQSGVKHWMESFQGGMSPDTTPKMLRTGTNSAMVETAAIVRFLLEKELLTREEWLRRIADEMELEAQRYELQLNEKMGGKVVLDWRDP